MEKEKEEAPKEEDKRCIPEPKDFFLSTPLYKEFSVDIDNYLKVLRIEKYTGTIDAYCVGCKTEAVFKSKKEPGFSNVEGLPTANKTKDAYDEIDVYFTEEDLENNRAFMVGFSCTRNEKHQIFFVFCVCEQVFSKIGQHPSIATMQIDELKKYRKILGEEKYKEFGMAVRLNAHGVGIGSYVYLRRVFENLVNLAYQKSDKKIEKKDFDKLDMDRKIKELKGFLPKFMVEHNKLYKILSDGVHNLKEDECLIDFIKTKNGIELILDEEIARKEQEKKEAEIKRFIHNY